MPAAVVGTMFLITRIWDSAIDPVVGALADRTCSRFGKFRPYLLWMALPFGVVGALTFATPTCDMTGKIVYAYVTYTLMMMVYSAINVPYASLLGVISDDSRQRTSLSSYRMLFAFGGSLLVLLLVEPLVDIFSRSPSGPNVQYGWFMTAVVFAIVAITFFFCTFAWTKERVKPISTAKNRLKDDLKDLLRNRPWWILLGAGIAALIFNSIRDGAAVYYFKYYVQETSGFRIGFLDTTLSLTTLFLVLGQAANIAGILLVTPISNRIGKKVTYLSAMVVATALSIGFYFVGREQIAAVMVLQIFISVCAGAIFPLLWSMYADIADHSELKTGRRATGLIFSSSSMSQKFGWTIGGALTGWLLGYFGFEANMVQGPEVQTGIKLMVSIFPAVGSALSVFVIALYPLNEKKMAAIEEKLKQLRTSKYGK